VFTLFENRNAAALPSTSTAQGTAFSASMCRRYLPACQVYIGWVTSTTSICSADVPRHRPGRRAVRIDMDVKDILKIRVRNSAGTRAARSFHDGEEIAGTLRVRSARPTYTPRPNSEGAPPRDIRKGGHRDQQSSRSRTLPDGLATSGRRSPSASAGQVRDFSRSCFAVVLSSWCAAQFESVTLPLAVHHDRAMVSSQRSAA